MSGRPWVVLLMFAGCFEKEEQEGQETLTISILGDGAVLARAGIAELGGCEGEGRCDVFADAGARVTLTATPADGWTWLEWRGDCAGQGAEAVVTLDQDRACTAVFSDGTPMANIVLEVEGSGAIEVGDEFACTGEDAPCTAQAAVGEIVDLVADPDDGWRFARWEEGCAGSAVPACELLVAAGGSVARAVFEREALTVDRVVAGNTHTTVITTDGRRFVTGENANGELGIDSDAELVNRLVEAGDPLTFLLMSEGAARNSHAIASDGALYAWGDNSDGQLGLGDTADRSVPTEVGRSVTAIASGPRHTCVVDHDGVVACAGNGTAGELGDGGTSSRSTYERIAVSGATSLAAGSSHTCAVHDGGLVSCWGGNSYGQLGRDGGGSAPADVAGLDDAVQVAAGTSTTCVLREGGVVSCWGYNGSGNVGVGSTATSFSSPQTVTLPRPAVQVAVGRFSSFAVLDDGSVSAWGENLYGEFGDGSTSGSPTPVASLATSVVSLSAGGGHACAVTADGEALCWGYNGSGQLGDGSDTDRDTPFAMPLP